MVRAGEPQAFPRFPMIHMGGIEYHSVPGMTLRDWFAGQIIGRMATLRESSGTEDVAVAEMTDDAMAGYCYELADAMMKARAKHG
jgi:hypothetical protein